jgi:sugar/nucleoside kinase (ribokinase family)
MGAAPLRIEDRQWRCRAMIGVGGIGTGRCFALEGNHTLGREESRAGSMLDRRDYCKLHIISHYVQTLLGPAFTTLPIGHVGDDDEGRALVDEMAAAGLDARHVRVLPGVPTLFSFCFVYPDRTGGNLTTADSASSRVDAELVNAAESDFAAHAGRGVALAVPEVPLAARAALLDLGTRHNFYRVAAFTTGEMAEASARRMPDGADLVAMNLEEASAMARLSADDGAPGAQARLAIERIAAAHPRLALSVTAGRNGSWVRDGASLQHLPALTVPVESTAGAGDAHVAGLIAGVAAGLSLAEAHHLAVLVAALSVTSPHTIHPALDRPALRALARGRGLPLPDSVGRLLEDPS